MLLTLPVSAYHASLVADDDALYLLTAARAYRLSFAGQAAEMSLDLGFGATASRSEFVFWSQGAVVAAPKSGGDARRIVPLATRPQLFAASGDDLAWLERTDDARFSVHGVVKGKARKLYASKGSLDALAMQGDTVFFVERPDASSWRIGSVRATSEAPTRFTGTRPGRAPSMLVARESLHYYDGNRLEVRRLSFDLSREATLASDFICSPLAVARHVYCARVEGLFELAEGAAPRRIVPGAPGVLVTDLAATTRYLAWVADAGENELELRIVELSER